MLGHNLKREFMDMKGKLRAGQWQEAIWGLKDAVAAPHQVGRWSPTSSMLKVSSCNEDQCKEMDTTEQNYALNVLPCAAEYEMFDRQRCGEVCP